MSLLFSPYSLNKMDVKSCFVHSATQECMSGENGEGTDELIERYVNLAKGETGLIIPGDMYVNPLDRSRLHQTGIHSVSNVCANARLQRTLGLLVLQYVA